jgi:hypothetical protein
MAHFLQTALHIDINVDWITNNAASIGDILTPIAALIIGIVAIFTYRRAKETILQPLRSEVIKRQAQKMTELLEFLASTQEGHPSDPVDYFGLCALNVFMWLDEYGFRLEKHQEFKDKCQSNSAGFIALSTADGIMHDIELPTPISPQFQSTSDDDLKEYRHQRYQRAKSGQADINDIDKIFVTKKFDEYIHKLDSFIHDPLLPSKILDVLQDLRGSIIGNLTDMLRSTIADFITTLVTRSVESTTQLKIDQLGVYNMFNRKRIRHADTLQKLRTNIREYLKVDSAP